MRAVSAGRRVASRRQRPRGRLRPGLLLPAVGVTLTVVAWGYLVYAAVDFGAAARAGETRAWWYLALASLGAVACLFTAMMLLARLLRGLGITRPPRAADGPAAPATPEAGRHAR